VRLVTTVYTRSSSDDRYVDFNDDSLPELPIGRLPVNTLTEAQTVISKIIGYGQGAASNTAVLVAHNNDENVKGDFQNPFASTLGEDLLKASNGGAAAVWASSALTLFESQVPMNQTLFQNLFASPAPRIGDAMLAAKAATVDPDVRRSFMLFGDPAEGALRALAFLLFAVFAYRNLTARLPLGRDFGPHHETVRALVHHGAAGRERSSCRPDPWHSRSSPLAPLRSARLDWKVDAAPLAGCVAFCKAVFLHYLMCDSNGMRRSADRIFIGMASISLMRGRCSSRPC
jgi:hypothetical protein